MQLDGTDTEVRSSQVNSKIETLGELEKKSSIK